MNSIYDEIHALDQTIKFLNEEAGHSHMGYYHTKQGWAGQQLMAARDRLKEIADMPEPKDTGWIKLSERKPTEADACDGLVLVKHSGSAEVYLHGWSSVTSYQSATHFLPLPKFEEKEFKVTRVVEPDAPPNKKKIELILQEGHYTVQLLLNDDDSVRATFLVPEFEEKDEGFEAFLNWKREREKESNYVTSEVSAWMAGAAHARKK